MKTVNFEFDVGLFTNVGYYGQEILPTELPVSNISGNKYERKRCSFRTAGSTQLINTDELIWEDLNYRWNVKYCVLYFPETDVCFSCCEIDWFPPGKKTSPKALAGSIVFSSFKFSWQVKEEKLEEVWPWGKK